MKYRDISRSKVKFSLLLRVISLPHGKIGEVFGAVWGEGIFVSLEQRCGSSARTPEAFRARMDSVMIGPLVYGNQNLGYWQSQTGR
jgi:hypothetical protein